MAKRRHIGGKGKGVGNGAGRGGNVPPPETRFKPGWAGGPGRPTAGLTIREQINQLIYNKKCTERQLRTLSRSKAVHPAKRIAAARLLRAMEQGDLADFEPWLVGMLTLEQLRKAGVNTEVVKKAKIGKVGREIEMHDRAGEAMDAVIGHTELSINEAVKNLRLDEGKPTENFDGIEFVVPGLPLPTPTGAPLPPPPALPVDEDEG